jgi:hypothetical protein
MGENPQKNDEVESDASQPVCKHYTHTQEFPSKDWLIVHGLNRIDTDTLYYQVIDSAGEVVEEVSRIVFEPIDSNSFRLHFPESVSGKVNVIKVSKPDSNE